VTDSASILLLYHSRHGAVAAVAEAIAEGVESVDGACARLRRVPEVSPRSERVDDPVPVSGPPYAELDELASCDGLLLGSPSYFGSMASPLKHFIDQTSPLWLSGALIGKPAGVFTSASSLHGGHESVLLEMIKPLLHHGMLIAGIPYSEPALLNTRSGCAPYGASHDDRPQGSPPSAEESACARALGRRVAELALRLKADA